MFSQTRRIDIVCPLTTWMQHLRGYKIKDKRNYDHSYIAELLGKMGINVFYQYVSYAIFITAAVVTVQYVLLFL